MTLRVLWLALAIGCAAQSPRPTPNAEGAIEHWVDEERGPPGSVRIARSDPPRVVRPAPRERIARGRPLDARFRDAPLESALRLLAEAADVNLVVGEGVTGVVTADLRRVPPLEAMRALAEAHGVTLEFVGRTVIARGRL